MSRLLFIENCGSLGHRIFCAKKKGQSSFVSAHVPSHRNGCANMDSNEIPTWRTFNLYGLYQFNHSYCDVLILPGNSIQSEIQKQCLVEKVYNPNANCK